jgi:hypothetical protein
MRAKSFAVGTLAALWSLTAVAAQAANVAPSPAGSLTREQIGELGKIVPGRSTKADVRALFGEPWRIVQFNDCGEAMDDQQDETWEYRGGGAKDSFRLHVEFNDDGTVHLVAKILDNSPGGKGTIAKSAPHTPSGGMSM